MAKAEVQDVYEDEAEQDTSEFAGMTDEVSKVEDTQAVEEVTEADAEPESEPEPEVETPDFRTSLPVNQRAIVDSLDLTQEQVEALGKEGLSKIASELGDQWKMLAAEGRGRAVVPAEQASVTAKQEEAQKIPVEKVQPTDGWTLGLSDEDAEEPFYKPMKETEGEVGRLRLALGATLSRLAQVEAALGSQAEAGEWFAVDKFVENLGEDYAKTFGKGTAYELATDSETLKMRDELRQNARGLQVAFASRGRQLTYQSALQKALQITLPETVEQQARKKIAKEVQKRKGVMAAKPSARKTVAHEDVYERARRAYQQAAEEIGLEV